MNKKSDEHGNTLLVALLALLVVGIACLIALRIHSNQPYSTPRSQSTIKTSAATSYDVKPCVLSNNACFEAPKNWSKDGPEQYTLDHSLFGANGDFDIEWTASTSNLGKNGDEYIYDLYGDYGQVDVYTTLISTTAIPKFKGASIVRVVNRYLEPVDTYTGEKNKQVYRPVEYVQQDTLFASSGLIQGQEVKLLLPQHPIFKVQVAFNKQDDVALLMTGYPKYDSLGAAQAAFSSSDAQAGHKALLSLTIKTP